MDSIILDENQISNLIRNKSVHLCKNKFLEIFDDELVLNDNGYIHNMISVKIEFSKRFIENRGVINFIRNLICLQFNLEPCNIIFTKRINQEFHFKIHTNANYIGNIVVFERREAEINALNYDLNSTYNPKSKQIGRYKQLIDSAYFFTWVDDI